MLILLPPSEGKTGAVRGRPVDLATLGFAGLTAARETVLDALTALSDDPARAAEVLGLGPTQAGEVARNGALRRASARPAAEVYTGVLYEALDVATLPAPARRSLGRSVVVFSGLWGAVRLGDRIPAYRCPVGASLPGLGGLGAFWRRRMSAEMDAAAGRGLVIDLRSGAYAAMWAPSGLPAPAGKPPGKPVAEPVAKPVGRVTGTGAGRVATLRVLQERRVAGVPKRTVVSHFNKATKGRIVRDLALAGARPATVPALVSALRDLKYTIEENGRPGQLDVVVTEL